jgi:anti-sigma factor ChrR (cupin superfamily)
MTRHDALDEPARERAALHALGLLPSEEADPYEAHLRSCPACRGEVETLGRAAGELALLGPLSAPPEDLRGRLLDRVRREATETGAVQAWKRWSPDPLQSGVLYSIASESAWEMTAAPGVETRRLSVDPGNDRVTMLVRMAPGSSYPPHRHHGAEECYVVEGDLVVGERTLRAGDFKLARSGSIDPVQATRSGCVLFITSSLRDELLPDAPSA